MSKENVELVRRSFESFERGDVEAVTAAMTDDIVTHRPEPDRAVFHGKEGFFAAIADWTEGFRDWKVTPLEFHEVGDDGVIVRVRQAAIFRDSTVPVESEFWFAYVLREGKIARTGYYTSKDDALAALEAS